MTPIFETEYETEEYGRVQFMGWEGGGRHWVLYVPRFAREDRIAWVSIPAGSVALTPLAEHGTDDAA